jgi:long-chain acyl-CoA synthetase
MSVSPKSRSPKSLSPISAFPTVTAEQSSERQRRAAAGLRAAGCAAGDRVAIVAHNAPDVLALAIGALRTGVVPVMVNPDLTPVERDVILRDCEAHLVIDDGTLGAFLDNASIGSWTGELATAPLARPMHYTSGTTGRPKGVWSGLLDSADAAALLSDERSLWGFAAGDCNLVCSPLYHSAPLRFATGTLLAGGSVVVLRKFSPPAAAEAIRDRGVNTAFMAPAHLQRIFELPEAERPSFEAFRLLAHAGAPCPPLLKRQTVEAFPPDSVWEFYGSTEGQFTACSTADWLERPGSVGRARSGRTMTIDAETGVLWCQVPPYARFTYWNDPAKTASAWRGDRFSVFDLGRIDDDGYVYLDGRRDDLLITGGVNVYPLEVELALAAMPGVVEVAVFGVDDERWGTRVCAAIVCADADPADPADATDDGDAQNISAQNISAQNISAQNVRAQNVRAQNVRAQNVRAQNVRAQNVRAQNVRAQNVRAQNISAQNMGGQGRSAPVTVEGLEAFAGQVLAPYKRPKQFVFVDSIPKTATGKVRRSRLAEELGVS